MSSVNEIPPKAQSYPWSSASPSALTPTSGFPTQMLGSRTRPASYGRSSSWTDSNQGVDGNTVQMYPEISSTRASKPSWPTSSWEIRGTPSSSRYQFETKHGIVVRFNNLIYNLSFLAIDTPRNPESTYSPYWTKSEATSETWYPVLGNQLNNEVDEPNQLGLTKPRNSSFRISSTVSWVIFGIIAILC